jgi:PKHD-type hydroxylase
MPYTINQIVREHQAPYTVFADFFTAEECERIVAMGTTLQPEAANIGGGPNGTIDPSKRISQVRWLNWISEREWLFCKLADAIAATNNKWYGFHLAAMNEPLQLTHYKAEEGKNGHYTWHEDHGEGGNFLFRKLSLVVPLNDGFEGGRFRMLHHEVPEQKKGTMIVFPSFKTHCVEPVTAGERWSLVGWINGPAFV